MAVPSVIRRPAPHARSVVAVLLLVGALVVPAASEARAGGDAGAQLTTWVGEERAAAGRPGLAVSSDLVEVATRHARRMAADGRLRHNAALGDEVGGWSRLTENVGKGFDARSIHDAFMGSSTHRGNILDAGVSQVGVGTAWDDDGTLWVAQVFREPSGATATPSPAPSPSPTATTPAPPPPPAATTAPPTAPTAPTVPSAPAPAPSPTMPRAAFVVEDVTPAPGPGVPIGPADHGSITTPPSPALHRLRTAAWWVAITAALLDR